MFASLTATAQNGVNSPYSRYGFGVQADRSMGFNKGMSGVAQGFRSGQIINVANPASYSAVDSVTALFDIGMTLQNGNFEMGNVQHNARNTSLDYACTLLYQYQLLHDLEKRKTLRKRRYLIKIFLQRGWRTASGIYRCRMGDMQAFISRIQRQFPVWRLSTYYHDGV